MATKAVPATEDTTGGGDPPDAKGVDKSAIREVVGELLAEFGIAPDDGTDAGDGATKPPAARTQAAVEADVESQVRGAIDKLRTEEDRDRRLAALEQANAKPEPERPPVKQRVSTRLMGWGRRS